MSMLTPSNMWIFILLLVLIINFVVGFIIGNLYMRNLSKTTKEREKRYAEKAKEKSELKDFYENIRKSADDLVPFLDTLEMVIHDAINALPIKESELVCSTYNYYIRLFRDIAAGIPVSEDDLINFANIHMEYSRIVEMFKQNDKINITDFDKISLN